VSIDLSQFVGEFLQESLEGLDTMESNLLDFTGDAESIDSVFRAAHSIKGGASTFGFSDIAGFTHGVETILDHMRSDCQFANADIVNLLLESVDMLRSMLQATQDDDDVNPDNILGIDKRIQQVIKHNAISQSTHYESVEETDLKVQPSQTEAAADDFWLIEFKPALEILKTGNEPIYIFEALAELGELDVEPNLDDLPDMDEYEAENLYISWAIKLKARGDDHDKIRAGIEEVFEWVEELCELNITAANAPVSKVVDPPLLQSAGLLANVVEGSSDCDFQSLNIDPAKIIKKATAVEVSSVRVDTEKLDELMNRVGELVVTQAMLAQALDGFHKAGHQDQGLEQGILQLEGNTRDLQEGVMRMRMLPISFVFNRFPRLVHDACSNLGKKATLDINGAHTEIDKTVMEKIGDPLTHLIRNALDHGIELPQDRIACGKAEEGVIALNAYHQNGFVVIDIIDDGMGLNLEKIKEKAIAKQLILKDQTVKDEDLQALIFKAGFSTAQQVSELSGRGVGMDVVQRNIESLGGQVSVVSHAGQGCLFSVKVPLTLAIIEGQLIHVNEDVYVLPLVSISETVYIKKSEIRSLGAYSHFMSYRAEYIHLIDLETLFDSQRRQGAQEIDSMLGDERDALLIIITESGGKKVGLVIDHLAGQQQFVVKPLEKNFRKVHGLVGGTILGDGSVALILDTAGLIARDEYRNNVIPIHTEFVDAK